MESPDYSKYPKRIDTRFRWKAFAWVFSDLLWAISIGATAFFSLLSLIGTVPVILFFLVRTLLLLRFLITNRARPILALCMYTTVETSDRDLRRTANLSMHMDLYVWYLLSLVVPHLVHSWAFCVLFIESALGAFPPVLIPGFFVLILASYLCSRRSAPRFYEGCIDTPVAAEFERDEHLFAYARGRSAFLRKRMIDKVNEAFIRREAISSIPKMPVAVQRRSSSRTNRARAPSARRKDNADNGKKRKKRND